MTPAHRSGFVAIIGRPNVGKSTLLNAYLGQKVAIVSDKPQTTRVRQLGILTRPDVQVIFVDTPGVHTPLHLLGEGMVKVATECIADADVIVFLVDGSALPGGEDRQIAELIRQHGAARPLILALNKSDLASTEEIESHAQAYLALLLPSPRVRSANDGRGTRGEGWIALSASSGRNREALLEMIVDRLPEGPAYYDDETITDRTEREIAAELIREQVLSHVYQEVPHAVAVVVDEWKERPAGNIYVRATIYVEKDSQKGILIGQRGQMLKAISAAARQEIEHMAGAPIFLEVWVKLNKNWRKKDKALKQLGYTVARRKT
ncbi:MAG: GTPase Era [Thermoflexales bacterium]|nr:GTPase Era [Thermoflexales bacterium]